MFNPYNEGDEPVPGYRLTSRLGGGELSAVWKVSAPGGTEAALKIVSLASNQTLKEFRSLRLLRRIRHPHIVPLMAFWLKDSQGNFLDDQEIDDSVSTKRRPVELILAMGLGDKSLADRLRECQAQGETGLPPGELLRFLRDAARGIDHLNQPIHDLGSGPVAIQHCDIKPQNILIVGDAVQVCDLGVVRVVGDPRSTAAVGSAAYMAPEVIKEGRPSAATDQYALAITYYELRTGRLPFDAPSSAGAYFAHLRGKLDFSLLPAAERSVLARATAMRPEDRLGSCADLADDLDQACRQAETASPTPGQDGSGELQAVAAEVAGGRTPASRTRKRRWRVAGPLILIAALGFGSLGAWLTRSPGIEASNRLREIPDESRPVRQTPDPIVLGSPPDEGKPKSVLSSPAPFLLESSFLAFASLQEALAAARDGDTVTIHGNGPFVMEPLEVEGKVLTLKAAPGFRPIFQRSASAVFPGWQPLLASDRDLTLYGLELRSEERVGSSGPTGPAYLICCQRAALRLVDCRLLVPHGSAAVVGRHARAVELRDCSLVAYASAVCVEVGGGGSCAIQLTGNSITIEDPSAVALSVYGSPDIRQPAAVQLYLERNVVSAGRVGGFKRLTAGLRVEAYDNDFHFREALVSFVAFPRSAGWRTATSWSGQRNRYFGRMDWLQVEGKPGGIHSLADWQALWSSPETGSQSAALDRSYSLPLLDVGAPENILASHLLSFLAN